MLSTFCNSSMQPQANFNLVLLPPESDSLVTQVDIGGGGQMAKWATQARTKCAAYVKLEPVRYGWCLFEWDAQTPANQLAWNNPTHFAPTPACGPGNLQAGL